MSFTENQTALKGWKKGFEPSTPGTTIRCSNQLSYIHHLIPLSESVYKGISNFQSCK